MTIPQGVIISYRQGAHLSPRLSHDLAGFSVQSNDFFSNLPNFLLLLHNNFKEKIKMDSSKEEAAREAALRYHRLPRPGKMESVPTKPFSTPEDLSLAYSPGVAYPCLEIDKNKEKIYTYTNRGNTVAVISNGTAVLGLGNIGAKAAKPVMEGKALLFKIFAGIDAVDVEIDETDPAKVVEIVRAISPTFGGINLEDIKAPECFEIEQALVGTCGIPVMHDDQHGTATIVAAAMINACHLQGKNLAELKVVVNGAGAAAIACTDLLLALGIKRDNVVICDSKGVIHRGRKDLNAQKARYAVEESERTTLAHALVGADAFVGLSVADVVTPDMLRTMAEKPIVFALANPNPEIARDAALSARPDLIYATGRSDYPNQINNVLGFPYIFRGALDSRSEIINDSMKLAAAKAIAELAREEVPDDVKALYPHETLVFGREYILPKPFDHRLLCKVAPAVVKAAEESGVANRHIDNLEAYGENLGSYVNCVDAHIAEFIAETCHS